MEQNKPTTQTAMLLQILQDMAEMKAALSAVTDHETRIRELEKARWSSAWLTGVLSAVISSGIVAIVIKMIGN